jgi:hypothetical protein
VVRDGRVAFTPVTPGIIGGVDIEISGIDEQTPLVVGPFQALREMKDGAAVRTSRQ